MNILQLQMSFRPQPWQSVLVISIVQLLEIKRRAVGFFDWYYLEFFIQLC